MRIISRAGRAAGIGSGVTWRRYLIGVPSVVFLFVVVAWHVTLFPAGW